MLAMEGPGASFDFKKHVLLSEEAISSVQVHSLTEMGYNVKPGQLDFAYTDPFPFLSEEGLKLYREALTSPEVAQNCYYNSAMVPLTVRNATGHSKFLHQMSTDNHLLNALQQVTGGGDTLQWHPFQLEQMMTNIQRVGVNKPSFAWHNDSNDFVLLVQLSDIPEDAVGGGTLMQEKHGDGMVREIRAPKAGYAYLMQGKVVWHAGNASENWIRCISIISFVSKDTLAVECLEPDTVNLHLARNYTPHDVLFKEYGSYRLKNSMQKLEFLADKYFNGPCTFESKESQGEVLKHLDHLIENLQITRHSLGLLPEWPNLPPAPLPFQDVPLANLGFGLPKQ